MMGINVLSCFDGISCGQLALQRAGIQVDNYFASEIDKYAIKITQKNFPNTVQLGDIQNWKSWDLPKIDLLIGGSPCQGFSNAGLGLNFEDPRSKLFFTFCDILAVYYGKNRDMKYLLENVKMKKEWRAIITDYMKVEPVLINSALLSAQNRERLYWANWEFGQPEDRGIYLKDIVQSDDEIEEKYVYSRNHAGTVKKLDQKAGCFTAGAHSGGNHSDMTLLVYPQGAAIRNQVTKRGVEEQLNVRKDGKSNCVAPSYPHKLNGVAIGRQVGRRINSEGKRDDYNQDIKPEQRIEVTRRDGKSGTISTVQKDNLLVFVEGLESGRRLDDGKNLSRNYREGYRIYSDEGKAMSLSAMPKGGPGGYTGIYRVGTAKDIKGHDYNKRVYSTEGKSPALAGKTGENLEPKVATDEYHYRKLIPLECERLQTLPEGYTEGISNTQRYKCIGNGWTVDVVAHIFSHLKEFYTV